jgi:hypothetical protein
MTIKKRQQLAGSSKTPRARNRTGYTYRDTAKKVTRMRK